MKYAIEETPDHWINKFNNRYANAAEQYSKTKRPRPIVDTASKNELEQVSRTLPTDALVANLFEGFSNFINQIIEVSAHVLKVTKIFCRRFVIQYLHHYHFFFL